MDPVRNPYSPGAGTPPAALVGRDAEIGDWDVALRRIESARPTQPQVLYGLRGVGKTVLLSNFARRAEEREWIVARVEARTGTSLREALANALHEPLVMRARPSAGRKLLTALKTLLSFRASVDTAGTWTFGVDLSGVTGGVADTGSFETDLLAVLRDVSRAAADDRRGLAVLVDEAQDLADDELTAICAGAHAASQDGWALALGLAGLPSLPRILAEAKSYSERLFSFASIGHLEDSDAGEVLTVPATTEGVTWHQDAVQYVVEAAGGYPYFLQEFGQDTWNAAEGMGITITDARIGVVTGRAALDDGFFRARWDRATRGEQRYLRAMAEDGDAGSGSGDVASRLGMKVTSLGPTRSKLIAKGLVYAPEHGVVAFTVPGMADFISRQADG